MNYVHISNSRGMSCWRIICVNRQRKQFKHITHYSKQLSPDKLPYEVEHRLYQTHSETSSPRTTWAPFNFPMRTKMRSYANCWLADCLAYIHFYGVYASHHRQTEQPQHVWDAIASHDANTRIHKTNWLHWAGADVHHSVFLFIDWGCIFTMANTFLSLRSLETHLWCERIHVHIQKQIRLLCHEIECIFCSTYECIRILVVWCTDCFYYSQANYMQTTVMLSEVYHIDWCMRARKIVLAVQTFATNRIDWLNAWQSGNTFRITMHCIETIETIA